MTFIFSVVSILRCLINIQVFKLQRAGNLQLIFNRQFMLELSVRYFYQILIPLLRAPAFIFTTCAGKSFF